MLPILDRTYLHGCSPCKAHPLGFRDGGIGRDGGQRGVLDNQARRDLQWDVK